MATFGASEAQPRGVQAPRGSKTAAWFVSLALATVGMWFFVHGREGSDPVTHNASSTPTTQHAAVAAVGMLTLADAHAGYRLQYPATWSSVAGARTPAGAEGHVIRIGGKDAFSVETFPLERSVTSSNLADMRAVTDAILSTPGAKLTVLEVRQVKVAGLPAIYYLYYFPSGKQQGIHAHYFIFDGARMHTLVFQVVPAASFARYAATFDQVVASFEPTDR